MLDLFDSLRCMLKVEQTTTDHLIFRLHYKVTAVVLLAFSLIVTSRQYFGDPIVCLSYTLKEFPEAVNAYCWIHPTFTLKSRSVTRNFYPGLGTTANGDELTRHEFYPWVCFVLFLQAIAFYTPRYLWKIWEGGTARKLVARLELGTGTDDGAAFLDYVGRRLKSNGTYAYAYVFCELMCLVNLLIQIYALQVFLGGQFITYGLRVVQSASGEDDPMREIFPRLTKCPVRTVGPSGDVQYHDTLCVLPLNVINEKIFIVVWFWFAFLIVPTMAVLLYRLSVVTSARMRRTVFTYRRSLGPSGARLLETRNFADWFLLLTLAQNSDCVVFDNFLERLGEKVVPRMERDDY